MLIYFHWEAQLISHLASKKTNFPFNNLKELSQNSKFKLIIAKGSSNLNLFKDSDDPVRIKIWNEKLEPILDKLPLQDELGEHILNDPYAVVYSGSLFKMKPAYIDCKI